MIGYVIHLENINNNIYLKKLNILDSFFKIEKIIFFI